MCNLTANRCCSAGKMMFRWKDVYTIEDDEQHGINCTSVLYKLRTKGIVDEGYIETETVKLGVFLQHPLEFGSDGVWLR
jgi:hypothetical protein